MQDSDPLQQTPLPTAISDDELAQQLFAVSPARMLLGAWPSVLLDVVCPVVSYQVLTRLGLSETVAPAASAIFPLIALLAAVIRQRHVEVLSMVSLLFIAAGVTVSLMSGNPRFLHVSGSLFTGSFGLLFLLSLLLERPLAFYLGRQLMTGGKPELMRRWDGLWKYRETVAVPTASSRAYGAAGSCWKRCCGCSWRWRCLPPSLAWCGLR